jgi:hypothetical protein
VTSGDVDPRAVPARYPGVRGRADAAFPVHPDGELWMRHPSDGTTWQIGGSREIAWIVDNTRPDGTIATAIPSSLGAYATVIVPAGDEEKRLADAALLDVLRSQSSPQPWWLGYLETGVAGLVFPAAPRVRLYTWPYVLVKAGPDQAAAWRTSDEATPWHSALPELMFPLDRSWLVSTLWDDDWRCVGGTTSLVEALLRHPRLDARAVTVDGNVTPPGHEDL